MKKQLPLFVLSTMCTMPALATTTEQVEFFKHIAAHCGKAFEGMVTAGNSADSAFSGKKLVMHVRECSDKELKVPFHVGDDHSRTWVITKTDSGLRLKHDHRHQDGTEDKVTMYGGDTIDNGSAQLQSFPVDQFSIDNFNQNGLSQSITNVWHVGISETSFMYRLTRENRDFKVEFDLTKPVALPPAPWGHE
ncbi:hypothetical protein [Shewanella psychrotolerans]|uniref:hypothetical protein n=1 Tax=Shewanella psychrotolerans TaxID=2864206 RepID=UPI001C6605E3|nr:hypothetical protein [Shewanella psychrotolerans]QYK01633.1 hypothetical protein K0I62_01175 [Shewanella psychrotolerans]